jgi:signal transduction histidine kinase
VAREAALGRLDVRAPERKAWLRDDTDDLSEAVNHMLGRINLLMQNVRLVSADIAHNLRTPLTRVGQKLNALRRRHAGAPGLADDIETIHGDLAEALRTFDAMLRLAEIESHGPRTVEAIDLARLAQQVGEAYRPDAEESGRRLDVSAEPASATGDPDLVVQAAANLLDNALRHTPPGTRVVLATGFEAGQSFLSVRDDGPGIDEAHRAMVLERFVRLQASQSGSGTGLGLAIVAAVAKRHHARLDLMDRAPGLEVRIRFPAPDAGGPPAGIRRRRALPSSTPSVA